MKSKKFKNNQEIQSVIDCIHDGIYITDGQGTTLMVNEASKLVCAKEIPNIIGKNVIDIVEAGYWSESICLEVIKQKKAVSKVQVVNGVEILSSGMPYFENGEISYIVTIDRNVFGLAEMQRKLMESQETIEKYQTDIEYYKKLSNHTDEMVCQSNNMRSLFDIAMKIAKQDVTVLISGETGTGKEVLANLIYENSERKNARFIKINCAAIPENLLEAELFGYEKGAFTGADHKGKIGLFELADKGTILLDEIGELPYSMQSKLLRVLQEKELMRIGGQKSIPVDVRIIAATNANLKSTVASGTFREDLFYRLNVISLQVPPLRERPEDIMAMASFFLSKYNKKYHAEKRFDDNAVAAFVGYPWPGNVRELANIIERLILTSESDQITHSQIFGRIYDDKTEFPIEISESGSLMQQLADFEKQLLQKEIQLGRNGSEIARMMGVNKSTISKKLKKYGIKAQ